jgi:hypothetical protein
LRTIRVIWSSQHSNCLNSKYVLNTRRACIWLAPNCFPHFRIVLSSPALYQHIKICRELIKQREKIKSKSEDTECWLFQRLVHHRSARTFAITFVIFVYFFVAGSPQQIGIILHTFGVVDLNTYYDWFNVMYYFGVSAVIILWYMEL